MLDDERYSLVAWDDPILRRCSRPLEEPLIDLYDKAELLYRLMREFEGVGLAANQIGLEDRMFVYQLHERQDPIALVNPEIIEYGLPKTPMIEGCLSIPGFTFFINRYSKVTVKALDLDGNEVVVEADEPLSQVFQHEIDHLNGFRVIDRILKKEKKEFLRTLKSTTS